VYGGVSLRDALPTGISFRPLPAQASNFSSFSLFFLVVGESGELFLALTLPSPRLEAS
jgi:hypothetical protein